MSSVKVVHISLAVPVGDDTWMDCLSNMRDDSNRSVLQWVRSKVRDDILTPEQAALRLDCAIKEVTPDPK